MPNEVKVITLGLIAGWALGTFAFLIGIISLFIYPIAGILWIVMAIIIFPPTIQLTEKSFGFRLSGVVKFLLVIVIFGLIIAVLPKQPRKVEETAIVEQRTTPITKQAPDTLQTPQTTPKSYQQIFTFSGEGTKTSESFTIEGDKFKIAYDCNGSLCSAYLKELKTHDIKSLIMNSSGSLKDETIVYGSGTYYIEANVMGKFNMRVFDFR